jgi:hypothetical protein
MNTRLLEASNSSQTVAEVKLKVDKINVESSQYKRHVEKNAERSSLAGSHSLPRPPFE